MTIPTETALSFAKELISQLVNHHNYQVAIEIVNYPHYIEKYYQKKIEGNLHKLCLDAAIPFAFGFIDFGLTIRFNAPTELMLHNQEMHLDNRVKQLIKQFGVVIFRNAFLAEEIRDLYHLNNFAHLNFHRDRHDIHENRYSLYTRNPFSQEQYLPRTASTLFIDNAVAYLQAYCEGILKPEEKGRRGHYEIFKSTEMSPLLGSLILNQPWNEPAGIGEIAVINNNSVLHSSYKRANDHGYSIGARYLF